MAQGPMACPIDGTTLVMSERQGIEIDYCPSCRGVWLDRGELDKLLERAAGEPAGAATQAPPLPPRAYPEGRRRDDDSVDDDPEEYHRRQQQRGQAGSHGQYPRKKRSWLGEILDFD